MMTTGTTDRRTDSERLIDGRMDGRRVNRWPDTQWTVCGILGERSVGRPDGRTNERRYDVTERQVDRIVKFTAKTNSEIPRNGSGKMDDRAFDKFARRLCAQNKAVLKRLAEDR
jgi:hypothetical protein